MFAKIQSFLEYIFGADILTIGCVFLIIHVVIETINLFVKSRSDKC